MTRPYMQYGSFLRATWPISCETTCETRKKEVVTHVKISQFVRANESLHTYETCETTCEARAAKSRWSSAVVHSVDSFMRATWLIRTCDMTYFYTVIYMRQRTHSHVWHDSFVRAAWLMSLLIPTCNMTHFLWQRCEGVVLLQRHGGLDWLIYTCDMNYFLRATWLIYTCDMNLLYLQHESFIHATLIFQGDMTHFLWPRCGGVVLLQHRGGLESSCRNTLICNDIIIADENTCRNIFICNYICVVYICAPLHLHANKKIIGLFCKWAL